MLEQNKNWPYYTIVITLFLAITIPNLLADGMFMDGLYYAAIAKNLAHGLGSFWYLHFTDTLFPSFHEHPPLAMALQSLFFKLLGDSIYVERIYSLLTYFACGYAIIAIWKEITRQEHSKIAWLPLLLWSIIPLVSWSCANNMLENTLSVFISFAVLFIVKGFFNKKFTCFFLAGTLLFLGFLTKGFVALFAWSLPFWIWVFKKELNLKEAIIFSALLICSTLFPIIIIKLFNDEGFKSLVIYFNKQVVGSIQNVQTVDSRFYIVKKVFMELIPALALVIIVKLAGLKKKKEFKNTNLSTWAYVFFGLALSGVLPIMVSLKQSGFYAVAAFPFFAITLALLIAPAIQNYIVKLEQSRKGLSTLKIAAGVLTVACLAMAALQVNRIGRDKELVHDVYAITARIPARTKITIPNELWAEWSLHGYFERHANISLETPLGNEYFLIKKGNENKVPLEFKRVQLETKAFDLYKRVGN